VRHRYPGLNRAQTVGVLCRELGRYQGLLGGEVVGVVGVRYCEVPVPVFSRLAAVGWGKNFDVITPLDTYD
jgi:hypothetical protein